MNGEDTAETKKVDKRTTYIASYRVGRIWNLGKWGKIHKSFQRGGGWKKTGLVALGVSLGVLAGFFTGGATWVAMGAGGAVGGSAAYLGSGSSRNTADSKWRPGYLIPTEYIEGAVRSEFTITEADDETEKLIAKNDSTEVGNFIYPFIHSKGFYKDTDPKEGVTLTDVIRFTEEGKTNAYCAVGGEKFVVRKDLGLSRHYLETHCYLSLKSLGDEIAKIGQLKDLENGDFGGQFAFWFTRKVTWIMHVRWDNLPEIRVACSLKEDLDSSSDISSVVKFVAQTAITVGTIAISSGIAAPSAANFMSKVSYPTGRHQRIAKAYGEALDEGLEDKLARIKGATGKLNKIREIDEAKRLRTSSAVARDKEEELRDNVRVANEEISQKSKLEKANQQADIARSVNRRKTFNSAVRGFSGLGRLMSGGFGGYNSPVEEFLAHKIADPLLEVEVKTSQSAVDAWFQKVNSHIFNWYFPFAGNHEIQMKRGFGWEVGTGSEILKDLHGWIQFDEHMKLLESMPNDLFNFWIDNTIFVYQFCCGEATEANQWAHSADCRRPRWKEDGSSFYKGFNAVVKQPLVNLPQQNHNFTFTQTNTISTQNQKVKLESFSYCFLWCGGEGEKEGYDFTSQGSFVIYKVALSIPEARDKGIGYGNCWTRREKAPNWAMGNKYVQLNYKDCKRGDRYKFGSGSKYRYLCVGYPESNVDEEIWIDRGEGDGYWEVIKEAARDGKEYTRIVGVGGGITSIDKTTINLNLNALNLNITTPIRGVSGMESWGGNPPDGFGVGGGMGVPEIKTWLSSFASKEPVGGVLLPDVNLTRHQIPDQVRTSMINMAPYTEKMELPTPIEIPVVQQVHEQNYVSETKNLNLHDPVGIRGTVQQPTTTQKTKKQRERQTEN